MLLRGPRAGARAWTGGLVDLAGLETGQLFDVVLVAGNTVPLLEPGTLGAAAARLAAQLDEGGLLVCGFGLDAAHLPRGCPVTPLEDVDAASSRRASSPWPGSRPGTARRTTRGPATS